MKFFPKKFARFKKTSYLCTHFLNEGDPLAQLVEHNTFNVGVLGSNPKRITQRIRKSLPSSVLRILVLYYWLSATVSHAAPDTGRGLCLAVP